MRSGLSTATEARVRAHLQASIDWLRRAQDASQDGGVSAGYTPLKGWAPSFPEVTGYVIPTLLRYAVLVDRRDSERRALRMADWLLRLQATDGSYASGVVSRNGGASVFNTGQILFGLLEAASLTGDQRYLDSARRAGDWLVEVQAEGGDWPRHDYLGRSHVYNTRTAWALCLVSAATGDVRYRTAARLNVAWARSQADASGYFSHCAFEQREPGNRVRWRTHLARLLRERNLPSFYTECSLHTIGYTIQGLLESAWLLGDTEAERTATTAALVLAEHAVEGRLAGFYGPGWRPATRSACLTGVAQMAVVWLRLARGQNAERRWAMAADAALEAICDAQQSGGRGQLRGALPGSKPLWGLYLPFRYPSWAVKFAVDAFLLRLTPTRLAERSWA